MKPRVKTAGKDSVIALALTWDGARWPTRTLPPKARAFLGDSSRAIPSPRNAAKLFADNHVREIRVCWVPRLKGGDAVLTEPFATPTGTRVGFKAARAIRFGDVLGVVYRRITRK